MTNGVRLRGGRLAALRRLIIDPRRELRHNGVPLTEYLADEWSVVVFPSAKGRPLNADNLATVNDHSFLDDPAFQHALRAAEARWPEGSRDISWRLHVLLWSGMTALRTHAQGDLVELGTGRGYMAAGLCAATEWGRNDLTTGRSLHLFDTFAPRLPDEDEGAEPRFYYANGVDDVVRHFEQFAGVRVHAGLLPGTLSDLQSSEVCFVHIDLNHAAAEIASLDALRPAMRPGTFLLFDDSGNPGCGPQLDAHRAWARSHGADLLLLPTGQGLAVIP